MSLIRKSTKNINKNYHCLYCGRTLLTDDDFCNPAHKQAYYNLSKLKPIKK